jgi:hypothetical protein
MVCDACVALLLDKRLGIGQPRNVILLVSFIRTLIVDLRLTFCSLYSANEMIKLARWSAQACSLHPAAYIVIRRPLAQPGKRQMSLAGSRPAGQILLFST